jgi:UDP-N-acetylglucosamine 2-epimerase (non-hydrolysing)
MILFVIGTRPEYIKIKPLLEKLSENSYKTLFTGQHEHLLLDVKFDNFLKIQDGNNRLDCILKSTLDSNIFSMHKITHVVVQGDTTSALGLAISAFNHGITVIHLEAGLRTFDFQNPYPEEMNRQLISKIATIHLCPTELNKINLVNEKVNGRMYVVGNTVLDSLKEYKNKTCYENNVLITLHRRENHELIDRWFLEIDRLAQEYSNLNFLCPIHPNPNVLKHKDLLKHVMVCEPIPHKDLLNYLLKCKLVISDSGGLQEECSFLNKKILVCRNTTERVESLDITSFLCNVDTLNIQFKKHINDFIVNSECPFGDGNSCDKILSIFKNDENII